MPNGSAPDQVKDAVRSVLGTLSCDLTRTEATLLSELHAVGREVKRAKSEIASLRGDNISESIIPAASDELDAVLEHTAAAANEILDACEVLEALQAKLDGEAAHALGDAVTRIYEACSFQDITGQRITKVVTALKIIEARVMAVTGSYAAAVDPADMTEGRKLANGPQLPGAGTSQADVDKLLASFD